MHQHSDNKQKWTPNGLQMDSKWTPNGPRMDTKWTPNGLQMDPERTPNGTKVHQKSRRQSILSLAHGISSQLTAMITTKKSQTMVFVFSWSIVLVHQKFGVSQCFLFPHFVHLSKPRRMQRVEFSFAFLAHQLCHVLRHDDSFSDPVKHSQPFHYLEHKNIDGGSSL